MAKFNDIRELAQQNARWVSNSPKDWMNYLDVAARLYRYSFKDTLLIHAQRPDATACAELEVWNKKMNRWVNRGAKGIALLDDASPRAKLRYVFDIADTHLVQGGRTPILWRIDNSEHQQMILDHLADTYALTQTDSMNAALMELAQQLTAENLEEAMDGLEYEVADTFLEGLDEDNLRVRFRELMTNSIFYTLSRRCEQEPLEVLEDEDFIRIVDFNQLPVLTFLGNAVSEQCEAVLRDIGREMQKIYRKEVTEHLAKTADSLYNTSTDFSTLKRETETNITEGGKPYGTDLSPQGGLPVSEPDRTGRADEHWEVRDAAQDLSEGKQEELVSEYADERQAESASGADRRAGGEPDGRTDREPEREVSGSEQGNRTDGMGGTSEQSDRDGGRDRAEGIGVQLTADTTEQDLSEAEEEIASAFSLPSLPTVEQQIRAIEAPMQAQYADEITIPAEVVDEILRTGSNRSKSQLRLIYNFMTEQTPEEYTAFVKKEYGEGGKGFEIGGTKYAVWFDELGMQIAVGDTVRNDPKNKAFLSWEDVSCRIHQLLQQGEYAPKSVLDAARGNALHEHAEALSYMERDMAEGVAEMVFADTSIFSGGYPELTERLAKLIEQPEFLADLNERQYGEMVFYCGYKRSAGKFSKCYGGYYREYSVNAKVARAIKTVFYALDVVNQGMQEKQSITVRCMDIEDLEKQAEAIRVEQIKLYESYADGVLLRDAYIEKKKALSEKLAALQDSIRTEKEEQECADELDEEIRALTKQASEKTYIGGLTKECVDAFVSMVYLYDDQTMKIEFNCEDVIRRALEKYGA